MGVDLVECDVEVGQGRAVAAGGLAGEVGGDGGAV
jgi:hypothetical protein